MQPVNHEYFAALLEEQRFKQSAFDREIQIELLSVNEPLTEKALRQEYLKFLANRILQIDNLMEDWLITMDLNLTV